MRFLLPVALFSLLAPTLASQATVVKNGDFNLLDASGMPLLWKVTSVPEHNFKIVDHLFNGATVIAKGVSCTPGGASIYPKPYPLVILEQDVVVPAGVPLEFGADLAYSKNYMGTNVDRSQVKVYLGTQLLGTYPPTMKSITDITTEVDYFNTRFTLTTGGSLTLKITMERAYYATGVFCHLDNVFLGINPNCAFSFQGDRKLGSNFNLQFLGEPQAAVLSLLSTGPSVISGGIPIPGLSGTFQLDLALVLPMWNGALDSSGRLTAATGPFPNIPGLAGVRIWFQGLQFTPQGNGFGIAHPFAWF